MATVQRPTTNAKPQYETAVEQQFAYAARRLRGLDIAAWSLALAGIVLAYGLTVALLDRLRDLSTGIRLTAWCCFMAGVAIYLVAAFRRLAFRSVNPHFIARQLEQTVPDAKNSVINWIDLRKEPFAPVIRGSLGRRAARDLAHADAEKAISTRPVWWLGSIAGLLLVLQLGWLAAAPGQVWSLLQRAFMPFDQARIANQTRLTLLQPAGGDVSLAANQPLQVRVEVQGYVPAINTRDAASGSIFGITTMNPLKCVACLATATGPGRPWSLPTRCATACGTRLPGAMPGCRRIASIGWMFGPCRRCCAMRLISNIGPISASRTGR